MDVTPHSAHAWLWSSYTYAYDGDPVDAIRRAQQALLLSPRDQRAHDFYAAMCVAQYAGGNYEEAASWGLRAIADPGAFVATKRWVAAALAATGRTADAREITRQAMQIAPTQRVANVRRNSPFSNPEQRERYCGHLIEAGFLP